MARIRWLSQARIILWLDSEIIELKSPAVAVPIPALAYPQTKRIDSIMPGKESGVVQLESCPHSMVID